MVCRRKFGCKFLKDLDIFGKNVELFYKGKDKQNTYFGSVLEVLFMPFVEESESIKLQKDMKGENLELQKELGDLLDDCKMNLNQTEIGTPTDESRSGTAIVGSNTAVVS